MPIWRRVPIKTFDIVLARIPLVVLGIGAGAVCGGFDFVEARSPFAAFDSVVASSPLSALNYVKACFVIAAFGRVSEFAIMDFLSLQESRSVSTNLQVWKPLEKRRREVC
jgi:hypothetical protein